MKKVQIFLTLLSAVFIFSCSKESSVNNSSSGTGGSLARFTIVDNYMYTVDNQNLNVYDIAIPAAPVYKTTKEIGFNIETIYPYKNKLFIGSNTAMYIYNIDNPESPIQEGFAQHLTACDPVVANDSFAYLTIRSGNTCQNSSNELQIYSLTSIDNPTFINAMELSNPHGLGLNDTLLYVCDASAGLRIINVSNNSNPILVKTITGFSFFDCIVLDNLLLCMLDDGLALYDISNAVNPEFIEKL